MSAETAELVEASLQGDRKAFGKIVERYQSAVSGMAYSVTGDFAASEDVAQETFVIAWKRLGDLHKRESIAAWLCGIAKNQAHTWLRKHVQSRMLPPLDSFDEAVQPQVELAEAERLRNERSEMVWSVLANVPEMYREPLVLYYRQDRSTRDIAEALGLSEDCARQRLSRGRKLLRAEVSRLLEDTLDESRPGKAFTAGVLAALPALRVPAPAPAGPAVAAARLTGGLQWLGQQQTLIVCCTALVVAAGLWGGQHYLGRSVEEQAPSPQALVFSAEEPENSADSPADDAAGLALAASSMPASAQADASPALQRASIDGVAVFRDTGHPAPETRIVLTRANGERRDTAADEHGRFGFANLPDGDYTLIAYDASLEDFPEADRASHFRSERQSVTLSGAGQDVVLEVPPPLAWVAGRVYDRSTLEPIAGIEVRAYANSLSFASDEHGRYRIVGTEEGEWRIDPYITPVLSSGASDAGPAIVVVAKRGETMELDIPVYRGVTISGRVVDAEGNPVPEALVSARAGEWGWSRCDLRVADDGTFTILGGSPGEVVIIAASKEDLAAYPLIVGPLTEHPVEDVELVLLPTQTVTGRFLDERGRPIRACIWRRAVLPENQQRWSGATTVGETFEIALAPGAYELKGHPEQADFQIEQQSQRITVATAPLSGIVVRVATEGETTGEYVLRGILVDETGKPLNNIEVKLTRDDLVRSSWHSVQTDGEGRFFFTGLLDAAYNLWTSPGRDFAFSRIKALNPAETPDVTLVARKAARLHGRVFDAQTGDPLTRFGVESGQLRDGLEGRWEARNMSSADGAFSVSARLDEDWFLRVSADGYAPAVQDGTALSSGEEVGPLDFHLQPGRRVRGLVVDEDGTPVTGARIILPEAYARQYAGHDATATGSDGRFELNSVSDDEDFLLVLKEGFAPARPAVSEVVHVVLTAGGVLEGEVRVNGLPWSDVWVLAADLSDGASSYRADSAGFYRMDRTMEGTYYLHVNLAAADGLPGVIFEDPVLVQDGMTTSFDLSVVLGEAALTGMVTRAGAPAAGVTLKYARGGQAMLATSDQEGRYVFSNLPAGPATLSVCLDKLGRRYTPPVAWIWREILRVDAGDGEEMEQDIDLTNLF